MSNYLAIATVTEAIRLLAEQSAIDAAISGAEAAVVRPSVEMTANHPSGYPHVYVGLYLYQVSPNAQWRNARIPTRRSDGSMVQGIRSAYDLYYLLTCYGDDRILEPQRVLGSLLRQVAAEPVLTKARIKEASHDELAGNNLDTEVETIKLSLLPLSLEEFSKLWSVLFQTTYILSIALLASVVFIDGTHTPGPALPVYRRNIYVRPSYQPVIEEVLSQKTLDGPVEANQPIVAGDILVLAGKQLQGEVTRVRIGDIEVTTGVVSDSQVRVALTSPPFPVDFLRAGVLGVQVIHLLNLGTPETPHRGFESNVAAMVLRPTVTPGVVVVNASTVINLVTYHDATIPLNFVPKVGVHQRLVLLLSEYNPPADRTARAYRFDIAMPSAPPEAVDHVDAVVKKVVAGDYLLRVQVDGAESLLDPGPDPDHPKFMGPLVTI